MRSEQEQKGYQPLHGAKSESETLPLTQAQSTNSKHRFLNTAHSAAQPWKGSRLTPTLSVPSGHLVTRALHLLSTQKAQPRALPLALLRYGAPLKPDLTNTHASFNSFMFQLT